MIRMLIIFLVLFSQSIVAQEFYFAQITDTHLGYETHNKKTEKLIERINSAPFDIRFVLHTGDVFQDNLSNSYIRSEYQRIFSKLKYPLYVVPGNHDLLNENYDELQSIFASEIAPINQIFEIDSVHFVLFYSIPFADKSLPDRDIQKNWINHALDSLKNQQVIVCHHQPSVLDYYNNEIHESWSKPMMKFWEKLINDTNVDAVICGHFHRDELHWLGKVPVYVASSVAGFWGRQASIRIYHYKNGNLSYQTLYLNE
jgi:3',5'-cyclic AMP phosphodiesterase CpdA